jgi:carboxymethylenebutenolidase
MRRSIPLAVAVVLLLVVSAAAAKTPAKSGASASTVDTSRVRLAPEAGGPDAFVAWPAGKGAAPSVIVVHEWWGLNEQIKDVAKHLAREGYVAIVPDLYHGKVAADPEKAHELSRGLEDDAALADMRAAAAWVGAQTRTKSTRMGALGFCMGGGLAETFALADTGLSAVVMCYGHPTTDSTRIAALRAPLQGHFGAQDEGIPPAKVAEFKAALDAAGKRAEIYSYADAGHAFMHEGRASYRDASAKLAWKRLLEFFQRELKD